MANINGGNIAKGMYIMYKGTPSQVLKTEYMAPGKGSPIMRVKMRDVKSGSAQEFTYKTNDMVEVADVEKKEMQFLYRDGDTVIFMDPKTFEQAEIPVTLLDGQEKFLMPDLKCWVLWHEEKPIGVSLPPNVIMTVTEAPDSTAGNRVNAPKKLIKLENGVEVQAPIFIKTGERIIVDTVSGEYVSRAN